MTTDLTFLAYTAMLTGVLWIPYVVSQVVANGFLTPGNYRDPTPRPVPLWGKRADRAYLNAVEVLAPFAVIVILIHLTGKANAMTALWTQAFFYMRIAHAVVYLTAIPYLRTLVFTGGFVALCALFLELVR